MFSSVSIRRAICPAAENQGTRVPSIVWIAGNLQDVHGKAT
jgi:hypothetical protein